MGTLTWAAKAWIRATAAWAAKPAASSQRASIAGQSCKWTLDASVYSDLALRCDQASSAVNGTKGAMSFR